MSLSILVLKINNLQEKMNTPKEKHSLPLDSSLNEPLSRAKIRKTEEEEIPIEKLIENFTQLYLLFMKTLFESCTNKKFISIVSGSIFEEKCKESPLFNDDKKIFLDFTKDITERTFYQTAIEILIKFYGTGKFEQELPTDNKEEIPHLFYTLYDFLSSYNIEGIKQLASLETPIGTIKKDIYLCSLMEFLSIENSPKNILNNSNEDFIPINKEQMFLPGTIKFSFEQLKKIATSKIALEAYYYVCRSQYLFGLSPRSKPTRHKKEEIISTIRAQVLDILEKNQFFGVSFKISDYIIFGVTCSGYNVLIKKELITPKKFNEHHDIKNAYLLSTILHEVNHSLIRLNSSNINLANNAFSCTQKHFYVTKKSKKKNKRHCEKESGDIFDRVLIDKNCVFAQKDSEYLLDYNNWENSKDIKQFRNNYIAIIGKKRINSLIMKCKAIPLCNLNGLRLFKCARQAKNACLDGNLNIFFSLFNK